MYMYTYTYMHIYIYTYMYIYIYVYMVDGPPPQRWLVPGVALAAGVSPDARLGLRRFASFLLS